MSKDKKQFIQYHLESNVFKKKLRLAEKFEQLSGGGTKKKIQRLFFTFKIYLPYLFIVKWRIYHKTTKKIKLFWGREVTIPLVDYDSLALYTYGFAGGTKSELKLTKFLLNELGPNDVFYDIGANYGFFTYLAEELTSETHAFEPLPELTIVINQNTTKETKAQQLALSDKNGETKLYLSESTGLSTINANTIYFHSYEYSLDKSILVPTTTLDDYTKNNKTPTYLKIDVEGGEEAVVRGGTEFFKTHSPTIAMEIWGKDNGGEISMRAVNLLKQFGYSSFLIKQDGTLQEVNGDLSELTPNHGVENFVFKKK